MKIYITKKPIAVRNTPYPTSSIINILPANKMIKVASVENGWMKLEDGNFIFKSDNVVTVKEYNAEMINTGNIDKIIRYSIKKGNNGVNYTVYKTISPVSTLANNDTKDLDIYKSTAHIKGTGVKDVNTGNVIDSSYSQDSIALKVVNVDAFQGLVTLRDEGSNPPQQFTVTTDSVQIKENTEDKWQDITQNDLLEDMDTDDIVSAISNNLNSINTWYTDLNSINVHNTRSIFGLPYQFMPSVDPRYTNNTINASSSLTEFGRNYQHRIIARIPMLVMQAGIPEFMDGFTDDHTNAIGQALTNTLGKIPGISKDTLESAIKSGGRYYSLRLTPVEYFESVNVMCRGVAILLGIGDQEISINGENKKLREIDWRSASDSASKFGYYGGAVTFYINSDAQVSQSFSNGTTQSQLSQQMNQMGSMASEMQFLMGGLAGYTGAEFMAKMGQESLKTGDYRNANGMIDTILTNITTIIAGGRMYFPEIWSDSQFTQQYNVSIKLDSPTSDNLSLYLNILVPLLHILAFVEPRSSGSNTYIAPYLVRAFYKSMFNIDMGIITNCEVKKGEVGAWNENGVPTQIEIDLTIKDLYNVLTLPLQNGTNDLIGNPGQMDYLANLCGINIGSPDIIRTLKLWWTIRGGQRLEDAIMNSGSLLMQESLRSVSRTLSTLKAQVLPGAK